MNSARNVSMKSIHQPPCLENLIWEDITNCDILMTSVRVRENTKSPGNMSMLHKRQCPFQRAGRRAPVHGTED
jgi:hypothetical protein